MTRVNPSDKYHHIIISKCFVFILLKVHHWPLPLLQLPNSIVLWLGLSLNMDLFDNVSYSWLFVTKTHSQQIDALLIYSFKSRHELDDWQTQHIIWEERSKNINYRSYNFVLYIDNTHTQYFINCVETGISFRAPPSHERDLHLHNLCNNSLRCYLNNRHQTVKYSCRKLDPILHLQQHPSQRLKLVLASVLSDLEEA